ncbi:hypothetical protein FRC04_006158 [Tulasnella sp. 424]|nr:hypothetical protein FRC04_006158 [Tulasnella sp. 424]
MSSSVAIDQQPSNQNLADQVETGSARKRARNSATSATANHAAERNNMEGAATTRRDSVDDDRRSFVTAYESSPERPSAAAAATTTTTSIGDSAAVPARRRSVPPAPSSSSTPPPTGPPSSTSSANTSMASMPSRYMSIDGLGRVGENTRISIPLTRAGEEEEEDDRMDTDSPDVDAEDTLPDQERGRPTATSSVPAPLYRPSSSPEPSSSSSSTAGPNEVRNTSSRRRTPPLPARPVTRPSPVPPPSLWSYANDTVYPTTEPTPATSLPNSNSLRSTPPSSSASTAQPRPLSLTALSSDNYLPSPPEFRSVSAARRFNEAIEPLRRSPSPPPTATAAAPSPPTLPSVGNSLRAARRRQLLEDQRFRRTAFALASASRSSIAPFPPSHSTSTATSDGSSTPRNGPRLPPVIGSFPIAESDSSDEELLDHEGVPAAPTRPFSRSTSRPGVEVTTFTTYVARLAPQLRNLASSTRESRSSPVMRTSSQTPPPMVVEEPDLRAGASSSSAAAAAMDVSSSSLGNRQPTPFDFSVYSRSRHHAAADDDIALEPDLTPPIFAGPDDHVHDTHSHDHGDDHEHHVDHGYVEPTPPAAPPPPGPSAAPSDPPANQMFDMGEIIGFHHQVDTLGRLAESIGRGMSINRRTMQSAELELWELYPPAAQNWRIADRVDDPEWEARRQRLRTAYSNMARSVRVARSAFLDAERSLQRSRRELEAAMNAERLDQASVRAAQDAAERIRPSPIPTVPTNNPTARPTTTTARPVSMYDGLLSDARDDNFGRAMQVEERMLRDQLRMYAAGGAEDVGPSSVSSTAATVGASGAETGNGNTSTRVPTRVRNRIVQQRSASSAPSATASSVTVEDVPDRASQLRERAGDGWSPLQISPFVPPPSPPRPSSRIRPASRYSAAIDPYWIRDDSVESIDEFDIGDYEYYRNMTWNRRPRQGQREAEEAREGSAAMRHRMIQAIPAPYGDIPHPSALPTGSETASNNWQSGPSYSPSIVLEPMWGAEQPTSNLPTPPHSRPSRQNSDTESFVVSPRQWDYAAAGYARPEVSPLTPSYPLPPAPRLVPRNLSMSEMQIRTGYTPQPSRNNSLVPPSPHGGLSPALLGGSRSLLMGDRSPLPRMVEEPESMTLLSDPPDMTSPPWRGWTQGNIGRSEAPSRPSIAISRSNSSSTSAPSSMEPELLVTDHDSPWLSSGASRYTAEPEANGFGNSLHVPLGLARPQSVTDDIRRRLVTARSRQRLQSGMSPTNPQAAPPASPGPETAMQRANRFVNQGYRRREEALAVPRPASATVVTARVRRPVSIAEERPRTPSTAGSTTQPPGAPLDVDNAATSFVRTAAERTGSPSPTRSSAGAAATAAAAAQSRAGDLASLRLRALRRELARPPSLSRPSLDNLAASDSSSSRDSYNRLRRPTSNSFQDLIVRAESRRSSGYEFMDFPYDVADLSPFMESVIGGGFAAFSPPPAGGLSSEEISALPSSAYKDSEEAKKEERCPICLDDYEETSEVMGVPECNHFFHKGCLTQWLERNRTCPYCRKNIARRSGRRGTGSIGGRHHRPRPGPPPPPPPPGPSSSGASWRSSDVPWGAPDPARR